ncbi:hypothetical protein CCUS01_16234, partial [Colletotrichum cuscutae]
AHPTPGGPWLPLLLANESLRLSDRTWLVVSTSRLRSPNASHLQRNPHLLGNGSLHIRTPIHCNTGVNPLPHQHASAPFRKSESWHLTGLQGPLNDRSFAPVPVLVPSSSPSQLVCYQYDYRLWVQYTHNYTRCALTLII